MNLIDHDIIENVDDRIAYDSCLIKTEAVPDNLEELVALQVLLRMEDLSKPPAEGIDL